jgi:hypothetical protein
MRWMRWTLLGAAVVIVGCGPSGRALTSASAPPSSSPGGGTIIVTTAGNCPGGAEANAGAIELFPIDVSDNGRGYSMAPCQALEVLLRVDSEQAGCRWTDVESSDDAVLRVLPIPLPLPPAGGTNIAYIAVATGHASLTSSLTCPSGAAHDWAVTVSVAPTS